MIFAHGWTCDDNSWNSQIPVVSREYRVLTLDLPGHGRSGAPASGKFSRELFARAVEAVRAEAKVDRDFTGLRTFGRLMYSIDP